MSRSCGPRHGWLNEFGVAVVTGQAARSIEQSQSGISVLMHPYGCADIVMTMRLLGGLQSFAVPRYAVVAPNLTVFLQAERVLQSSPGVGDVGRTVIRCRDPNRTLKSGMNTSRR